ncbi:toll/interleukin-1 receptor domain-containing protein, partial [Frankia sp. Cj3]
LQGGNPEQWWTQIFFELDAGTVVDAPYRRLLRTAGRRFPGNAVFQRLAVRYLNLAGEAAGDTLATTAAGSSKIFLCHASQDKPRVRDLYKRLRGDGFEVWLDTEALLPGQDWDLEIRRAIRTSRVVLVCLSSTSTDKRGYVQKEIKHALDVADEQPEGSIFLIPVQLEHCELPDRLQKWHWVNLFEEDGYTKLVKSLRATG